MQQSFQISHKHFLALHKQGELILVNPDQIQAVLPCGRDRTGSYIYFPQEEDPMAVDETVAEIDELRLI